jgi:hypothetical protein
MVNWAALRQRRALSADMLCVRQGIGGYQEDFVGKELAQIGLVEVAGILIGSVYSTWKTSKITASALGRNRLTCHCRSHRIVSLLAQPITHSHTFLACISLGAGPISSTK